jgi:hypothetical protein
MLGTSYARSCHYDDRQVCGDGNLFSDICLFSEDSGATAGNEKEKGVFSHSIVLNAPYLV